MVGLVVVSHSHALAAAAVGLAAEMVSGQPVPIAVAAGLDEETFGTDAQQIQAAIEEVDGPEGVVVLMDLGSAILSAEMALEFLDEDARSRVRLSPAPLIEGLIAAAVTAAGGAGRAEVGREAERGLRPKLEHLGKPEQPFADAHADGDLEAEFTIVNDDGLHARPAAILVATVRRYDAEVSLRCPPGEGPSVSAGSLTDLMTMTAGTGARVQVRARGPQAQAALDEVLALAERGFSAT
jgi:dihydroxyacetone kinase phosphotransfer subunit